MITTAPKVTNEHYAFSQWMRKVDELIVKRTGCYSDDLPDYCYRDDYDDGATHTHAASAAIRNAKNE